MGMWHGATCHVVVIMIMLIGDISCLPVLDGANQGVAMLGVDVAPPAPDQAQQAGAMEAAANQLTVAKAATAASKVDGASSKDAKQAGKAAAVSKAAAAGADTKAVAAAVAAQADPKKSVATSSADDAKEVTARGKITSALVKTTEAAMYAQKKQETSTLAKAGGDVNAAKKSVANKRDATPEPRKVSEHAYHKFDKLTVKGRVLRRLQGSISECQTACNQADDCKGVEYSKTNGGVCILLRDGITWSREFDYYEKDDEAASDPAKVTKHDSQLMWDKASERSHDLGGLAMSDVPGASLYKPPSKMARARAAIRRMDRPIELGELAKEEEMKERFLHSKAVQSHAVAVAAQTKEQARRMERKAQVIEGRRAKASLRAAKIGVMASHLSATAAKQKAKAKAAAAKDKEFTAASTAFSKSHNPMAQEMLRRAVKWRKKAKKIELAAHADDMHAKLEGLKAKAAEADADHWRQQAQWAALDSKAAQKHVNVAVKTEKLAMEAEKHRERQAKIAERAVNCRPKCDPKAVPKPEPPTRHTHTNQEPALDFGRHTMKPTMPGEP